jgi:tetratricopeptide (TPR) repeat protein
MLLFFPVELSALYLPPMKLRLDAAVAASAFFAIMLAGLGVYLYRKQKHLFFWYAVFFVGLLPVSQIVPLVTFMNDRYLYFPLIGAAGCCGIIAASFVRVDAAVARRATGLILCILLVALPVISRHRTSVWNNDLSLWQDITRKLPGSPLAWNGLGMSYVDTREFGKAADAFLKALTLDPDYKPALGNIGALYNSMGKTAQARPYLLRLVGLFPDDFKGLMNLGINYYRSGDFRNAEMAFARALTVQPGSEQAMFWLQEVRTRLPRH